MSVMVLTDVNEMCVYQLAESFYVLEGTLIVRDYDGDSMVAFAPGAWRRAQHDGAQ